VDIIHRRVFYLEHDVSEPGFCLCLQVGPTQLGQIDRASACLQTPATTPIRFVVPGDKPNYLTITNKKTWQPVRLVDIRIQTRGIDKTGHGSRTVCFDTVNSPLRKETMNTLRSTHWSPSVEWRQDLIARCHHVTPGKPTAIYIMDIYESAEITDIQFYTFVITVGTAHCLQYSLFLAYLLIYL
jgi:hypothetical protein